MATELTERQEKKEIPGKRRNMKDILRLFCGACVYVFLFFLVFVYSLYAPEGYIQIATHKYLFYKKLCLLTAKVMIPAVLLYCAVPPHKKRGQGAIGAVSATDVFVLLFLLVNIISFFCTEFKEEALWGTSGWYMGFGMQLFFMGTYFMLSRFYDDRIDVMPFFMASAFVVFLWGLLNRFSIYPVDMHYDSEHFISSMGNINWFCGFWSVFFAIGVVLYVITERRRTRIFTGIFSVVSLGLGAVEGSDSAFLSMGAVFFFLFLISFQKTEYMKRWLELGIFYCAACQVMRIIVTLDKKSLSMDTTTMWIMLGNLTLTGLILLCALRVYVGKAERKYKRQMGESKENWPAEESEGESPEERETVEKEPTEAQRIESRNFGREYIREWMWLKYAVIGLVLSSAVIYLALLFFNTRAPGSLGALSKYSIFLFDGHWGSARGATWRDGLAIFQTFSFRERLFGVGQDCFSAYGYSIPELSARLQEEWPGSRLTNAHNECLTHLVNVGIFGMLSFIGIFWSSFRRLLDRAAKEPLCYVFAASLLSYFIHNQFSFAQVLNTPYIYAMLGLGENLLRRSGREEEGRNTLV